MVEYGFMGLCMVSKRPIGQPLLTLFFHSPEIPFQEVISCSSTLKWFEVQNHVLNRGTQKPREPLSLNLPCGGPDTISFSVAVSNVTPRYGFPWGVLMLNIWPIQSWKNSQYIIFSTCGLNPSGESNSEMTRTGGLGLWRIGRRLTAGKQSWTWRTSHRKRIRQNWYPMIAVVQSAKWWFLSSKQWEAGSNFVDWPVSTQLMHEGLKHPILTEIMHQWTLCSN